MLSTYISIMLRFFWTNPFIFFLWTALVLGFFFFFFCSFPLFCWWHFQNVSHFENVSLSQTYLLWLITQSSPLFSSLPKNQLEILLSHSSEVFMIQSWEKTGGKKEPDSSTLPTIPFTVPQFANIPMKSHGIITVDDMRESGQVKPIMDLHGPASWFMPIIILKQDLFHYSSKLHKLTCPNSWLPRKSFHNLTLCK